MPSIQKEAIREMRVEQATLHKLLFGHQYAQPSPGCVYCNGTGIELIGAKDEPCRACLEANQEEARIDSIAELGYTEYLS